VLRYYRDTVMAGLPDELTLYAGATTTPDGVPVVAVIPCYSGPDLAEGERLLQPLRSFGPPIADLVTATPYTAAQQMFDAAAPYGIRSYWKSNFLHSLPDDAIDTYLQFVASCPSLRSFLMIENTHGVAARVPLDATACHMRTEPFNLVLMSLWQDPAEDDKQIAWTRNFYAAMQSWSAGSVYVNTLSEDDGDRVAEAYGPNFSRLLEVKRKHDPTNRFRHNQNIRP
jgi:hypothetical protein